MKGYSILVLLSLVCFKFSLNAAEKPFFVTFTEADWLTANIIRVPFTLSGAVITVQARVNEIEGNFFFDTGASKLILNQRIFGQRSDAPLTSTTTGVTGLVNVQGAFKADSLKFDQFLVRNISADVIDLIPIENAKKIGLIGIIGFDVFRNFEIIFDYGAGILLFIRLDKKGNRVEEIPYWEYTPIDSFSIKMSNHIAKIQLVFGKEKHWFGLDSGAEQNLLSNHLKSRFLQANFKTERRMKLRGMSGETVEVLAGTLNNAHLDSIPLPSMATILANIDAINGSYQTALSGILGYEFLSQKITGINFKRRKLTRYKNGPTAP